MRLGYVVVVKLCVVGQAGYHSQIEDLLSIETSEIVRWVFLCFKAFGGDLFELGSEC